MAQKVPGPFLGYFHQYYYMITNPCHPGKVKPSDPAEFYYTYYIYDLFRKKDKNRKSISGLHITKK